MSAPSGAMSAMTSSASPARRTSRVLAALAVAAAGLGVVLTTMRVGPRPILDSFGHAHPAEVVAALGLMCLALLARAVAWREILIAALRGQRPGLGLVVRATSIGVLLSAALPARAGEPARALVVARRAGQPVARVAGTVVSQSLLNVAALIALAAVTAISSRLRVSSGAASAVGLLLPIALPSAGIVGCLVVQWAMRRAQTPVALKVSAFLAHFRDGLVVLRSPRRGLAATAAQLLAWALQWLACLLLLASLGLGGHGGARAAAAVLLAVNLTAAVPVTPSNLGVFQAACVAVLSGAYGISAANALSYGVLLQGVEIAAALAMGVPALVREGLPVRVLVGSTEASR